MISFCMGGLFSLVGFWEDSDFLHNGAEALIGDLFSELEDWKTWISRMMEGEP